MNMQLGEIDSYNTAVAEILRRLYDNSEKSYSQLAEETGIDRATIVSVINNERPATAGHVNALAREFDTTAGAIFTEADLG